MCVVMAALHSRCGYYIFVLFLSSFFPHLISAVADWMSLGTQVGLSAGDIVFDDTYR